VASWIDEISVLLDAESAFNGLALQPAIPGDAHRIYALHREALRAYVEATWGWDEAWQRAHFTSNFLPSANARIVDAALPDGLRGRVSLSRHWRHLFLRDIELEAPMRNRGIGAAILRSVLLLARREQRAVELLVLDCNPARALYERLGFAPVSGDGARTRMRAS
jgi:GNAT superfamily N-acetyltransferase